MSSNFSLTTFANDGKLEQVNNAIQAANNGETSIGIQKILINKIAMKTKEGIILACEKQIVSNLIDETSFQKIQEVSKFIGGTYSGLGPDFKVILKKARKDFQTYKMTFNDDLMPIHSISREVANLMQVQYILNYHNPILKYNSLIIIYYKIRNTHNPEVSVHSAFAFSLLDMIEMVIIYIKSTPQVLTMVIIIY